MLGLTACSTIRPELYDLRCEGLAEPLAIDSPNPHFSWKIRSLMPDAQRQYEIAVASTPQLLQKGKPDLWHTRQKSADQVLVPYGGRALPSRSEAFWRVRIWQGKKASKGPFQITITFSHYFLSMIFKKLYFHVPVGALFFLQLSLRRGQVGVNPAPALCAENSMCVGSLTRQGGWLSPRL